MTLYIDPSTGSMLFAILIGAMSAFVWLVKGWVVKLRFLISGGKLRASAEHVYPFVIFSDDKRYWSVFEPICRELNARGIDVTYMTASPDDPALKSNYPYVHCEFIGEGNRAFAKLNFLEATVFLSTTPGLDVYQWKRSKGVKYYVHLPHAASDITIYRMFGIDYYDAVLLSGEYQVEQIRKLEALWNFPPKDLSLVGIPYMDVMKQRLEQAVPPERKETTVLLAPSWGSSAIFSKFGGKIIDELLKTNYHIIIRPHPQSFTSEKEMIEKLMAAYPASERLEWNRDADNFDVLNRSDILISDFSGVVFDFTLVYDKPVIYADTSFDVGPYDAWWLQEELWTFRTLPKIGEQLTEENMGNLTHLIENCLHDPRYAQGRKEARAETWVYPGEGAVRVADFLVEKYRMLTNGSEAAK